MSNKTILLIIGVLSFIGGVACTFLPYPSSTGGVCICMYIHGIAGVYWGQAK